MENNFASLIESSASILVLLPEKPSFDTVASGLSLYLSLHDQKEAAISCPTPMTVGANRLVGINKIGTELGNKNLTIRFKGYDATSIDKVSYDIIEGEFKLAVVPKSGFVAPQKDQIEISYAGVSADLVILVGGATDSDFPILESGQVTGAKVAHIGVRTLAVSREVMSFAGSGASVSELVARIIKENGMGMDPDIATNLVMGIEEETNNFQSGEVTPDTFEVFADLLRSGGLRMPKVKLSPVNFPPGSIPTRPFEKIRMPRPQTPVQIPQEADVRDLEGTFEAEQDINPPDDWLQPKIFKGAAVSQPIQPDSFSENKG